MKQSKDDASTQETDLVAVKAERDCLVPLPDRGQAVSWDASQRERGFLRLIETDYKKSFTF